MMLTRFLGYFARVEAPTTPAKIQFLMHTPKGEPFGLATIKSVEFNVAEATWTVNLAPGLIVGKTPPPALPGEKKH